MNKTIFSELVRFAGVGVANTLLDFCIFLIMIRLLDASLVASNFVAWSVAFTFSYFVNGRGTFRRSWNDLFAPMSYLRVASANLLSFGLATTVLVLLSMRVPLALAKGVSLVFGFLTNFSIGKYLIGRGRGY
jgi:putative flippase GtrA